MSAGRSGERGLALISVLWALVILSLIAADALTVGAVSYRIGRNMEDRQAAEATAEAAIYRAVLGLQDRRPDRRWPDDGSVRGFSLNGCPAAVSVVDEASKVDLNSAEREALIELFEKSHVIDAQGFADRIIGRREGQDARNRFQSIEELNLVAGMTPALYEAVRRRITVYSHLARPQVGAAAVAVGLGLAASSEGRAYGITAEVGSGAGKLTRESVVLLTGDRNRPFLMLAWR